MSWLALVGCQSGPDFNGEVEKVVLLSSPAPIDVDGRPGADGFLVKIYAFSRGVARPVSIQHGSVEFQLYSRGKDRKKDDDPLKIWSFEADDLASYRTESMVGVGYSLILRWGDAAPSGAVEIVARLKRESGELVYSRPVSLALSLQQN